MRRRRPSSRPAARFVDEVYAVEFTDFLHGTGDPNGALVGVARDWDYVLDDARSVQEPQQQFLGLGRSERVAGMALEIDLSGRVALVTGGSRGLGRADA